MLKMKKIIATGVAILTLGISGCTKSSNPSENTGGNSTTPSESAKPTSSSSSTSSTTSTSSDSTSGGTTTEKQYIRVDKDGNKTADGEYVLFGFYPQTKKDNSVKIATPVVEDSRGYYLGDDKNYYAELNSGTFYKVEPIKWKLLSLADGKAMLLSESILDSKAYQSKYEEKDGKYYNKTQGVPVNTFANYYEHSEIRSWLIGEFYNKTFTEAQKEIIKETIVDNSLESTGYTKNPYVCENTTDKVFLLSYKEATIEAYGFIS